MLYNLDSSLFLWNTLIILFTQAADLVRFKLQVPIGFLKFVVPMSSFQSHDAVKVLHSICQQIQKTQQWSQECRVIFLPIPKKGNAKERSNYCTITLISHASKVMLIVLQVRLQQYVNHEVPAVQARFRKGRGTRDQVANICWITEKAREFQEKSISVSLTMLKALIVWITTKYGIFLRRWTYQTILPAS